MTLALIDADTLHHTALWKTTKLEEYKVRLHALVEEWTLNCAADKFVLIFGGPKNFRNHLLESYKKTSSRVAARKVRPEHETASKEYLKGLKETIVTSDIEADDLIAIMMTEDPENRVIVSADKDLKQVPGFHSNPHYKTMLNFKNFYVTPSEAFEFLQLQLLTGDPVDNIPGLPKVGPKTAQKLLASGQDPVDIYQYFYGDSWEENFLLTGKLVFLLRYPDKHFSLELYRELAHEVRSLEALSKEARTG
jgi:5'-3' exonuclease